MQPRFGMIEVELDATQNFVIDDKLIAQLNDRPALHVERVLLQTLDRRARSIHQIGLRQCSRKLPTGECGRGIQRGAALRVPAGSGYRLPQGKPARLHSL